MLEKFFASSRLQGKRIKQPIVIPAISSYRHHRASQEAASLKPGLDRFILPEQIQPDAPEDRNVFRRFAPPQPGLIFAKGDVQRPVQLIFYAPMHAHDRPQVRGIV